MARKANPVTPEEIRRQMLNYHSRVKSWRRLGTVMDVSASYAQQVANGGLNASEEALNKWLAFHNSPEFESDRVIVSVVQLAIYDNEDVVILITRKPGNGTYTVVE